MPQIGRWNKHKFIVSSKKIESFTGLTIKGSSETENKTGSGNQQYVSRKNGKPKEVSLTVHLHRSLGVDVRTEANKFVSEARSGDKAYFYIGNKKLDSYRMMLTEASVSQIEISHGGKWVSADVALTLKQAGAKKKKQPKKKTPTQTKPTGPTGPKPDEENGDPTGIGVTIGALMGVTGLGAPTGGTPAGRAGGGGGGKVMLKM